MIILNAQCFPAFESVGLSESDKGGLHGFSSFCPWTNGNTLGVKMRKILHLWRFSWESHGTVDIFTKIFATFSAIGLSWGRNQKSHDQSLPVTAPAPVAMEPGTEITTTPKAVAWWNGKGGTCCGSAFKMGYTRYIPVYLQWVWLFWGKKDEQIDFQTDFGVLHFQTNSCGEVNVVSHIPFTQVDHFGDIQNHTKNGVCVCLGLSPLRVTIKTRLVLPTTVWWFYNGISATNTLSQFVDGFDPSWLKAVFDKLT
jgi:hypothetical protein